MIYSLLFKVSSYLEKILSKNKRDGTLSDYVIDVVPDDLRIEVVMFYRVPVKSFRCRVAIESKGNTDNAQEIYTDT